ncbi:hypothetical protein C5S31_06025 [ANME-1 cluster archaeon GoMg2]|nr:hypothetical protein [ANME-1 cluster archaeon GoMg2]
MIKVEKMKTRDQVLVILLSILAATIGYLYFQGSDILYSFCIFAILFMAFSLVIHLSINERDNDVEQWIFKRVYSRWRIFEWREWIRTNPPIVLFVVSLLVLDLILISIIVFKFLIWSLIFILSLWDAAKGNVLTFTTSLYHVVSIIVILIFIAQALILYQQYRYKKQPAVEKIPPLWCLSKSKSNGNYFISIKNGGNTPIFNISQRVLEVLDDKLWIFPKIKFEDVRKDFLPRLDVGSEKEEIFEKNREEFKKMRLFVVLEAKSLGGYSMRLFFYKAGGRDDFLSCES